MSKVYEALQHSFERHPKTIRVRSVERPSSKPGIRSTLSPLKMEREMTQLQQRLAGLLPDPQRNFIQFMSCKSREGVSSIVLEFVRVLVEKQGKSVLLIDGDSEKMGLHQALGVKPKISLQEVLNSEGDITQTLTPVIGSRLFLALYAVARRRTRINDIVTRNQDLWNQLRRKFDLIVIDTEPIDISDEGLKWCAYVDGVVMVVEAEKSRSHVISNLKEQIVHHGGNFLGIVFNKQHHYIPKWLYERL